MQNTLTAVLLHCHYTYIGFAGHTGVRSRNRHPLQHSLGQSSCLVAVCCCAKHADSSLVSLPLYLYRVCWTYRCTVTKQSCIAAFSRAKFMPCCSVLLCNHADSSLVALRIHLYRVCWTYRCTVTKQSSTLSTFWGKVHALFLCAAVQTMLTAACVTVIIPI